LRQSVELQRPHLLQRLPEWTERLLVGSVKVALSLSPDAYKAGLTEDAQVLRHGAKADVEALGDVARGELAVPDQTKDFAAPRLGDDLQGIDVDILVLTKVTCPGRTLQCALK
jgi:hypothetical protein